MPSFLSAFKALAHFVLFLLCLGLIHAREIANLLQVDRDDQKEREQYYETPSIHGVSVNEIRLMEGDKLITYIMVTLYVCTVLAAVYALCTLGLLIGERNGTPDSMKIRVFFEILQAL